jgi:hypothetical protein
MKPLVMMELDLWVGHCLSLIIARQYDEVADWKEEQLKLALAL